MCVDAPLAVQCAVVAEVMVWPVTDWAQPGLPRADCRIVLVVATACGRHSVGEESRDRVSSDRHVHSGEHSRMSRSSMMLSFIGINFACRVGDDGVKVRTASLKRCARVEMSSTSLISSAAIQRRDGNSLVMLRGRASLYLSPRSLPWAKPG